MRIQPLSDFQKYELLIAVLKGDSQSLLHHVIVDYMKPWGEFVKDIETSLRYQRNLTCTDCNDLETIVEGIGTVTHRSYDHEDTDEDNNFTCNCSYCQWVLHTDCPCPKCDTNKYEAIVYKDYESGAEKKLYSRIN